MIGKFKKDQKFLEAIKQLQYMEHGKYLFSSLQTLRKSIETKLKYERDPGLLAQFQGAAQLLDDLLDSEVNHK